MGKFKYGGYKCWVLKGEHSSKAIWDESKGVETSYEIHLYKDGEEVSAAIIHAYNIKGAENEAKSWIDELNVKRKHTKRCLTSYVTKSFGRAPP